MVDTRRRMILMAILSLAAVMFLSGINWGLPSSRTDHFLFGARQPWTGQQIMQLAGDWDDSANRGADIAMHPLTGRVNPIVVNNTDAKRAQIVRRFRLYSDQPDEMITFRSLSAMKPGQFDFDPKFYQYGGLWVYPIGGLLKLAGLANLLTVKSDLTYYLDHPDAFARFYLIARLYSVMWGLVGVGVVCAIGVELTQKPAVGMISAALYAVMPVVVNSAHEAKPHLAGAVLTLTAILMAVRFVRTGKTRDWILAGITSGAAFAMVLTGISSLIVLPVMVMLRPMAWKKRVRVLLGSSATAMIVFVIANPYLPINLLFRRTVVNSNMGNYGNFYHPAISLAGLWNAAKLIAEGMSFVLAIGAILVLAAKLPRIGRMRLGWLLAAPAIVVAIQFVLLAHDQPAEYARFAITLDIILAIAVSVSIASLRRGRVALAWIVCTTSGFSGLKYVANFVCDTTRLSTRSMGAQTLADLNRSSDVLAVWAEPAPYCLPPVDLFTWKIVLLPRGSSANEVGIGQEATHLRTIDYPGNDSGYRAWIGAPISWADKPFEITDHHSGTVTPW